MGFRDLALLVFATTLGCSQTQFMDKFNEVSSIKYVHEAKGEDYWQTPKETERLGTGDCEDKAFYLQDKLKKQGIESEVCFGLLVFTERESGHAWVEYKLGGRSYVVDPTNGTIFDRAEMSRMLYFKLPERIFKEQMDDYKERLANGN